MSDSSVNIGDSVHIGRKTKIVGNIDIKDNVSISSKVHLHGNVDIEEGTNLNGNNSVIGNVSIGKKCAIAPRARMRNLHHPTQKAGLQSEFYSQISLRLSRISRGKIDIGNDVWICSDAKILSDVSIGDGAVVAANAVVVDDVEPYSIVAGNPAVHKGYRFDQPTRRDLQETRWWDWSKEKAQNNKAFFKADLREIDDIQSVIKDN